MKTSYLHLMSAGLACTLGLSPQVSLMAKGKTTAKKPITQAAPAFNRTVLPMSHPVPPLVSEQDIKKVKMPQRNYLTAPKGAPNVLIILIDDMGYGVSDAFGGPVHMPTMDKIAQEGLRFSRFHTCAVSSASRAALLTGRNSHSVNCGEIADVATGYEGNTYIRPDNSTPLAQILRMNGYNTAQFGKSHETPGWEITPSGPFDRWPTGLGFEKFYGFVGGDMNQYSPMLYDGTTLANLKPDKNYHFTTDMANKTIAWIGTQQTLTPDHPFFVYFAPGATHAPHHAPAGWAEKYKGKFDMGWDKLREQTLERQKALGIVPANTQLAVRPKGIPSWDSCSPEEQKLFARQMEVYAGFAEHTDYEIGRVIAYLESIGQLDNTIVYYIAGDNGASAEAGVRGTVNETASNNSSPSTMEQMMQHYDDWGSSNTFPHFAMGWASACNTPYPWVKQIAGHLGGSRVGMAVRYPKEIQDKGAIRSQFYHLIDVAPTILDLAQIPQPKIVNGMKQAPMDGVSMKATFENAKAPENHKTQYFSVFGNRGVYDNGWLAGTVRNVPWLFNQKFAPLDQDVWELYDLNTDFSSAVNLAASNPKKLAEMKAIFNREATKYKVFPIDDRKAERIFPALAGRPDNLKGRKEMNFYEGAEGIFELAIISVKNCEFTVTCDVELKDNNTNGVIIAQGGKFGGWTIYMKNGKPIYEHNFFDQERYRAVATETIPAGKHKITFHFVPDVPAKWGSGGFGELGVDGKKYADVKTPKMVYGVFSFDDGLSIGKDRDTNVSNDYTEENNVFTGKINVVNIAVK